MKKIFYSLLCVFLCIITISLSGCFKEGNKGPEGFDEFTHEIFVTLIGADEMTCNFYFKDRSLYGLENYEPSLPTPGVSGALGKLVLNLYFGSIKQYNYNLLSEDQQITYDIIVELLDYINNQSSEMSYLSSDYLGSYLGYQAQLPLLLTNYNFRNVNDIENYLKTVALVPETFKAYVDFEIEKANKGYGMNDMVIDKVIDQCNTFISSLEGENYTNHYMIRVIDNKLDSCAFLTEEARKSYKQKNVEVVLGPLVAGYKYVRDNLNVVKGKATNSDGLYYYIKDDGTTIGKDYYQLYFQHQTGYSVTIDEAIEYIDGKLEGYEKDLMTFRELAKEEKFIKQLSELQLMNASPEEQLNNYFDLIEGHFPLLESKPNIIINYVDKSMENNFSPAAYMISAIDEYENENIFLNKKSVMPNGEWDYNYLYTVLAHEGVPGHLYQNNYLKQLDINPIRKLIRNIGYTEGWATYCEIYSYNFLEGYDENIIDYLIFNDELIYAIYSRADMGIHYEGWKFDEVASFMREFLPHLTDETVQSVYDQLVEVPVNCQYYAFTYFKLNDLRELVESSLGENFDEVLFHKMILECGPIPLEKVEQRVKNELNIA